MTQGTPEKRRCLLATKLARKRKVTQGGLVQEPPPGSDGSVLRAEVASAYRPVPSAPSVGARMARQRTSDTVPELVVRRELHSRGLRYRLSWPVPGASRRTIDVAFPGQRVAVFVDGCF